MIGVSLLVVSTLPMRKIHTFAVSPNMVAPLLALLAILVAASILYGYIMILVIIVGLRHPHPVRDPHQALAGRASGGVGRQTQDSNARRGGRSDGRQPATPPVDAAARPAQAGLREMTQTEVAEDPPLSHLRLTARLNTSALDARRGVVRLHPEAIAALGIREWDAVSLTGSRTTAAVAGVAPAGTPAGTALLDDVTLSNAGLREDTTVIVAPVTVYGARSVTVTRLEPGHPVDLVGDAAAGPARQGDDGRRHGVAAAARPRPRHPDVGGHRGAGVVGRHHLDLRAADGHRRRPGGTGERATEFGGELGRRRRPPTAAPTDGGPAHGVDADSSRRPRQHSTTSRARHAQAGRLTEWLKLALDEPELLETLGATANLGVLVSGPARRRQGHDGAGGVRRAPARRTRRPRGGRAARRRPAARASRRRSPPCATAAACC